MARLFSCISWRCMSCKLKLSANIKSKTFGSRIRDKIHKLMPTIVYFQGKKNTQKVHAQGKNTFNAHKKINDFTVLFISFKQISPINDPLQ